MLIYPAMDLMGGRCVRLSQGRFDDSTIYDSDPAEALAGFAAAGAVWAHVVDLDGARAGAPRQHDLITALTAAAPLSLQVAGGVREPHQVGRLLDAGAGRVVVGSLAVREPDVVTALLDAYGGERIVLALDVNMVEGVPMVAVSGWGENSGSSLWDVARLYPRARHLLVTDISRDGMMTGPNFDLVAETAERLPHMALQASGGVASLDDIGRLQSAGAAGAIVGKALWERRIDLGEAIEIGRA